MSSEIAVWFFQVELVDIHVYIHLDFLFISVTTSVINLYLMLLHIAHFVSQILNGYVRGLVVKIYIKASKT